MKSKSKKLNTTLLTPHQALPSLAITYDSAINYAFQQNAIPIIKELHFKNDSTPRKDIIIRITTEPAFAEPEEIRIQAIEANGEFRIAPLDIKLSHDYLAELNEKVVGWLKLEVLESENVICSRNEKVALLARNEWCGLISLPEILAAFILPNDPAIMPILGRASELLGESTGRTALNGYQDKNRTRAWDQVAAIYKAISELDIRYINPPASFETSGQKIRFPSDIVAQRFGTCLDLTLLFSACCEQAGMRPFIFMHEGHAYAGCWLEENSMPEPAGEDLQQIRKLSDDNSITVFETTLLANKAPGTLNDAELFAKAHMATHLPFRLTLDVHRARLSRIHPLPIPGHIPMSSVSSINTNTTPTRDLGIGKRDFENYTDSESPGPAKAATRIDQWKSRLLDLSLRNRLLNFKETKSTIRIISASPEQIEDELAARSELSLQPKPKLMNEEDPRHAATYTKQQRTDALNDHLRDELLHGRIRTSLEESEHIKRLTELYRSARVALDENGTNTLFAAVGILEWRETEHSDRVLRAPILLVPVELKRKSVLEDFTLRRIDEDTRLNVTLMEMLRQNFKMEILGLDPLPEDDNGVDVARVLKLFRNAVRNLAGWEVKSEIWLGQFSFTKFLLWKDISDRLEELTRNRIVCHLVHEPGTPYQNPPEDIKPDQLDDHFHPRDIYCPRSADSSQLAAVMAASAGHDFVLEGPPGTGKSQTITNIIAHCLSQGKRILFVAEKRAALDVVHRRLREDGLEPFCLELHSNKTGKSDVLAQFDRTLKFVDSSPQPSWVQQTVKMEKLRASLNNYIRTLHCSHACGLSPYQCLDYLLPRQNEPRVRLENWPTILNTSAEKLDDARQITQQLQDRSRPLVPLADHALAPLACQDWSPSWAERAIDQFQELKSLTQIAITASCEVITWFRFTKTTMSHQDLTHLIALTDSLLTPQPVGSAFATTTWTQLASDLKIWRTQVTERIELRSKLRLIHADQTTGSVRVVCEEWANSDADTCLVRTRELITLTKTASDVSRDLRKWLSAPRATGTHEQILDILALTDSLIESAPVAEAFCKTPWDQWVGSFDRWISWIKERNSLRMKLADYHETKLIALDLDMLKQKWESGRNAWFFMRWLRIGSVRRHLRTARKDNLNPELGALEEVLLNAMRLKVLTGEITAIQVEAESFLGVNVWASGEQDSHYLDAVRAWGNKLHQQMLKLTGEDEVWLDSLRVLIGNLFKIGSASFTPDSKNGRLLIQFRESVNKYDEAYKMLSTSATLNRAMLDNAEDHFGSVALALDTFVKAVPRLRMINTELTASTPTAQACLGIIWAKGEPDKEAISNAIAWGKSLHDAMIACAGDDIAWLGQLRHLLAGLFQEGPAIYAPGTNIGNRLVHFRDAYQKFETAFTTFTVNVRLRRESFDAAQEFLSTVLTFTERLPSAWSKIREWCSWQKSRHEGMSIGLAPIIKKLESIDGENLDLQSLFERSFRHAFLIACLDKNPAIREFFGPEHSKSIEHFREIDEKLGTLSRDIIRLRLASGIPNDDLKSDVPKEEIGLLRKEISKKTRHIPVRQLLSRIPKLLPRLKPCVLMSPLSVAQYLEVSHEPFDLVIFDEASQIPVWDAIGAIARGKQLIVVGDPKQLPPTNFFNSNVDDDEDRTPEEHKDLESILDELMTNCVRHKRLKWHYRSRHEGLITFSNRQYYQNDLLTFPSPEAGHGGVHFKHIPEARYDKSKSRTNRIEAIALVDELVVRLRNTKGARRSFGVVTFSQAQQNLVEDLLDQKRRDHPEIEVHFGEEPPVEGEPVFVKNLESVQGDERDVILFSICYGPDESGKVSMNFGPLNRDGGERRLNVAITRAKHEVLVFSGLRADQIDLNRTRAIGVRDLKYFLDYADRGPRALTASNSLTEDAEPESEFEKMVADRIRKAGYEVHHQVGCSGYRIDLAIVDPSNPGRYLLGVECDGATYHRAATARDRDKLRQSILEGLGWKLYRIWSTDWWHDDKKEMNKLLETVAAICSKTVAPNSKL